MTRLLVCGLFLTIWDIYGETFKDILPPVKSLPAGGGDKSVHGHARP